MNKQQEKEKDLWKHKNPLFQKTARLPWNLQLFAQGGAGEGSGGSEGQGAGEGVSFVQQGEGQGGFSREQSTPTQGSKEVLFNKRTGRSYNSNRRKAGKKQTLIP
ncbi:MAG: hypothetical protein GX786_06285 [Clostridiales bacterium]|nr:hypothetical protein [Clostridiales bacterium]